MQLGVCARWKWIECEKERESVYELRALTSGGAAKTHLANDILFIFI